jgi:hypothetical protein
MQAKEPLFKNSWQIQLRRGIAFQEGKTGEMT